jgi:RNA-binding protein
MSSKAPTGYVELRVFVHATEETEKVLTAVRNLLPEELAQSILFEKTSASGHHGNPIILFTSTLSDKTELQIILQKMGSGISVLDKDYLQRNLSLHLDKRNLFLRFDKQSAFLGAFKFTQNDPIHVKIHFKNKSLAEIMILLQETGLLP